MADGPQVAETLPRLAFAPGRVLACDSELVGVHVTRTGRRLIALRAIEKGRRLFSLTGREIPVPTRYSVQIGAALHLDPDCASEERELVRRFYWRYLDHSCEPTTRIRGRDVVALRDVAEGDAVTFDYNTTEYELAEPFRCRCGSEYCVGTVRGARHLTPAQRARVRRWLPAYLR